MEKMKTDVKEIVAGAVCIDHVHLSVPTVSIKPDFLGWWRVRRGDPFLNTRK